MCLNENEKGILKRIHTQWVQIYPPDRGKPRPFNSCKEPVPNSEYLNTDITTILKSLWDKEYIHLSNADRILNNDEIVDIDISNLVITGVYMTAAGYNYVEDNLL